MDSARGLLLVGFLSACLLDVAFCLGDDVGVPPAPRAAVDGPPPAPSPLMSGPVVPIFPPPPPPASEGGVTPPSPAPPKDLSPPIPEVPPPPPVELLPPPVLEPPPPPPPQEALSTGNTWNPSEKAGVVIASIAALLQVAVVAFLLIKRHQMLTTVDYDDIDDLESDDPRHNANYRHADSA